MKQNIKKIFGILGLAILLYSCDTNNEVTGYDADNYNYSYPTTFTITEDVTMSNDTSFVVTYTPFAQGKGYYAVVLSGTVAPTSTQVHSGSDFQQAGSFSVDGSTAVNITVDSSIFGAYTYDVYAIHKSTDNYISETVTKISVTTPDTLDPVFLRDDDDTTPTHDVQPGANSPFTDINLAFSEPVYYNGGDVTLTSFFGGRVNIVNTASSFKTNGKIVTVDNTGNLGPGDAVIITWEDGTFVDNSGKNVAALSGISYYFWTRDYNADEATDLLIADWDYEIFNSAFNPAVLSSTTGTWSVTKGSEPRTIILTNQVDHDLNAFVGADDSLTVEFEVTVGDGGTVGIGSGYLTIAPVKSSLGIDLYGDGTEPYWTAYYQDIVTPYVEDLAGFYDLENRIIRLRLDYGAIAGWQASNYYLGDVDYIYNYIPGSGLLGRNGSNTTKQNSINGIEREIPLNRVFSKKDFDITKPLVKNELKSILNK